ncbi:uncharacterized protein BYT42DRAFT_485061, partial [Radiomyces spectabilis]|uniref:uncharacterized protein n=1 Tax=Radiomyces spectabilis TaxID=64574 RepID=UPI0022205619
LYLGTFVTSRLNTKLSKEEYLDRMQQLQVLVRTTCPSNHIDYYIFVFAISCIICSAAFSLIARSADISMWYPLILLLIPALLSFWTSRRRSTMLVRIKEFERSLKQILREFTKTDSLSRLRWSFRRPTPEDAVPSQYGSARLCLIIELAQLDPELGTYFADHNDGLPSYQTALL